MIAVTDLHGKSFYVNAELIETVQLTPDTQIVLTNGHRMYVAESLEEIAERTIAYKRLCNQSKEHVPAKQAGTAGTS